MSSSSSFARSSGASTPASTRGDTFGTLPELAFSAPAPPPARRRRRLLDARLLLEGVADESTFAIGPEGSSGKSLLCLECRRRRRRRLSERRRRRRRRRHRRPRLRAHLLRGPVRRHAGAAGGVHFWPLPTLGRFEGGAAEPSASRSAGTGCPGARCCSASRATSAPPGRRPGHAHQVNRMMLLRFARGAARTRVRIFAREVVAGNGSMVVGDGGRPREHGRICAVFSKW